MKFLILTIFLFSSTTILACESESSDTCKDLQVSSVELTDTEHEDCCNEYCFCNCCNQVSIISLNITPHIKLNNQTNIQLTIAQNDSGYWSSPWQPPKF